MKPAQRIIVGAGLVAISLMCMFPPWKSGIDGGSKGSMTLPDEYRFIWDPPVKSVSKSVSLDFSRLTVQSVGVICISLGAAYILGDKK